MADFYAMQAEAIEARKPSPLEPKTFWLVAAYNSRDRYWRLTDRSQYLEREAAEKAAAKLDAMWTHRTIIKIELPAKGTA